MTSLADWIWFRALPRSSISSIALPTERSRRYTNRTVIKKMIATGLERNSADKKHVAPAYLLGHDGRSTTTCDLDWWKNFPFGKWNKTPVRSGGLNLIFFTVFHLFKSCQQNLCCISLPWMLNRGKGRKPDQMHKRSQAGSVSGWSQPNTGFQLWPAAG